MYACVQMCLSLCVSMCLSMSMSVYVYVYVVPESVHVCATGSELRVSVARHHSKQL